MTPHDPPPPPEELLRRIGADFRPVRPRAAPWRRVAAWTPVAVVVLLGLPALAGLRVDARALGPFVSWGLSALQIVVAAGLVWMAAREGMPSRHLSSGLTHAALAAALAGAVGLTFVTYAVSPTSLAPPLTSERAALFCYRGTLTAAAPVLLATAWLLIRWLPIRPWLGGALAGMGAGLAADAGWRLVCPVSDPAHVLTGHTSAVLTLAVAGAATAQLLALWQPRK